MQYLKNRMFHQLRRFRAMYRHRGGKLFDLDLPVAATRRILVRNGIGFYPDGNPTWWYASIDLLRNEEDDLTKSALKYVDDHVAKDAAILGTGCGTGLMLFWLVRRGYTNVDGFDYLDNVVQAAKELAELGSIQARLWKADGFKPQLDRSYGLIVVLHWLYSAWMGNYGNQARGDQDREALLADFLSQYTPHLAPGGLMMIELIDSIADLLEPPTDVYPVRHSLEQVTRCAASAGLTIERRMFNCKYGYLPRMLYVLKRAT